jgi:hypothetical protein
MRRLQKLRRRLHRQEAVVPLRGRQVPQWLIVLRRLMRRTIILEALIYKQPLVGPILRL